MESGNGCWITQVALSNYMTKCMIYMADVGQLLDISEESLAHEWATECWLSWNGRKLTVRPWLRSRAMVSALSPFIEQNWKTVRPHQ